MNGESDDLIDRKHPIHLLQQGRYLNRTSRIAPALISSLFLVLAKDALAESSTLWSVVHPFLDPLQSSPSELYAPLRKPVGLVPDGGTEQGRADIAVPVTDAAQGDSASSSGSSGLSNVGDSLSERMTLSRAVDYALCRNAKVRASWSEMKLRASELGRARAAYLPTLNGSISFLDNQAKDMRTGTIAQDVGTRASVNLAWRIFDFGKRHAQHTAANWQVTASLVGQNATVLNAVIDVVQSYYDVQTTRAVLQVRAHMRGLAEQTLASAERRQSRGANAMTEVLQARASLARTELDHSRSEGEWLQAQALLVYQLGWQSGTSLPLDDEVSGGLDVRAADVEREKEASLIGDALDAWLDGARDSHPAVAAAHAQWQAAVFHAKAAEAEGLPNVDFSIGVFDNGRPTQGISPRRSREQVIGLTLNLPLFEGFSHTYRVAGAKAEAEAKRLQYEDTVQKVMFELVKMHARAAAAWRNLDAALGLQSAALQSSESLQRQFDQGAANVIDVTRAQRELAEAQLERIKAWAQWETAKMELMLVPGRIEVMSDLTNL